MKMLSKATLLATTLGLFTVASAFAVDIPREIYRPNGKLVKADRQGNGEYEVEYRLRGNDVRVIAKNAISHAKRHGFRVTEAEIERDDADLKFERGDQELDIQIEVKNRNRIEYKADLDLDKN
ncbi:hypothetical protein NYR68_05530 [Actinobacillus equuli subsp. haemolyticus]|uniref:hypothetical protein n=1 Tax=Actinobacillus equuli TaxID=718 RepID=UPI0024465F30|nr:hypothetical protein [Actinobacillus equuli]WGE51845.1 hypothetical protein NYR68_05530 [Actinobacillus equuli subsp. haemolyticus]